MKKVAFTIGMIAILVGVAFAGMAANWNPPTSDPILLQKIAALDAKVTDIQGNISTINTNVNSIINESYGLTKMDVYSGNLTVANDEQGVGQNWATSRHVSLTLWSGGIDDTEDYISIETMIEYWQPIAKLTTSNYTDHQVLNFQFDSANWRIMLNDAGGFPIDVHYCITSTYPSS